MCLKHEHHESEIIKIACLKTAVGEILFSVMSSDSLTHDD